MGPFLVFHLVGPRANARISCRKIARGLPNHAALTLQSISPYESYEPYIKTIKPINPVNPIAPKPETETLVMSESGMCRQVLCKRFGTRILQRVAQLHLSKLHG